MYFLKLTSNYYWVIVYIVIDTQQHHRRGGKILIGSGGTKVCMGHLPLDPFPFGGSATTCPPPPI